MSHAQRTVVIFTLATLLGTPAISFAGPIEWSYTASIGPDGGGVLRLETGVLIPVGKPITAPASIGSASDVTTTIRPGDTAGAMLNSQRLHLGSILVSDVNFGEVEGVPTREQFVATVTITDNASGQSTQVTAFGRAAYVGAPEVQDRMVLFELGSTTGHSLVTLGGNQYQLTFGVENDPQSRSSTLVLDVSITSATPEPATLVLAGLGLGGVGVVRRLRRTGERPA